MSIYLRYNAKRDQNTNNPFLEIANYRARFLFTDIMQYDGAF